MKYIIIYISFLVACATDARAQTTLGAQIEKQIKKTLRGAAEKIRKGLNDLSKHEAENGVVRDALAALYRSTVDWDDVLRPSKSFDEARRDIREALERSHGICSGAIHRRIWKRLSGVPAAGPCDQEGDAAVNVTNDIILFDIARTHLSGDVPDESGCATLESFRHRVGTILQEHEGDDDGGRYVQGEHFIAAFFLQRGAPASSLFARIRNDLRFSSFFIPDMRGVLALASAMAQYFRGTKMERFMPLAPGVVARWVPPLLSMSGIDNDSAEAMHSLYLACPSAEEGALLILRTLIHLFEKMGVGEEEDSSAANDAQTLMVWATSSEGKTISFKEVFAIAIDEQVREAFLARVFG